MKIEHWPGMVVLVLREDVQAVVGREVAPGIVFHYVQAPGQAGDETELALDNGDVVSIEIEAARGRPVDEVTLIRYDDDGNLVYSSKEIGEATEHVIQAVRHLTAGTLERDKANR